MAFLQFIHLLVVALLLLSGSVTARNSREELRALLEVKESLISGEPSLLTDWNRTINPNLCNWTGITCGPGRVVTGLNLSDSFLPGSIPPAIGRLRNLLHLDLSSNSLTGPIPTTLVNLSALESLLLHSNQLTGRIPDELGSLSKLRVIRIGNNYLTGEIPESLGELPELVMLGLASCSLTGVIPTKLGRLGSLEQLVLQDNQLGGPIPSELGNCSNLDSLVLANNKLNGTIPKELGTVPDAISNLRNLTRINFSYNKLNGSISPLCSSSSFLSFDVSDNAFKGEVPSELGNSPGLERLRLGNNQFTGGIPWTLGKISKLSFLDISGNLLTGELPLPLMLCRNLTRIDLNNNHLSGSIPPWLGTLSQLGSLDLSGNRFTGPIPLEIFKCSKLIRLSLENNLLNGTIPDQIGNLGGSFNYLMLSNNQFSGSVPASISNLTNLLELRLSHNRLSGRIPAEIGQLKTLMNILDLSYNNLTGSIPPAIGTLPKLPVLNLSHNQLDGGLPPQIGFNHWSADSFRGNPNLCGVPLDNCSDSSDNKHSRLSSAVVIVLSAMTTLAALALLGLGFALFCRRRNEYLRSKSEVSCIYSSSSFGNAGMKKEIRWDDIMEATNHLSDEFVIGSGGSGTIYRAELASGEMVAVKRVPWKDELMFNKSFAREVKTLGRIRHRHLVKLVGYCCNRGAGCNLLVYEYMENGSLWDWLHKQPKKLSLDWEVRLRIAAGLAKGVEYLHHDCVPSIIHRDIKSSNLLLDADMESHLGDFGLAKTVVESTESTSLFAGSYGYIAPEYAYSLKATEKSDVFSMGIVLMELVTGKAPTDSVFGYDMDMVKWVEKQMGTGLSGREELIDPSLMPMLPEEESAAYRVLEIALQCTTTAPQGRPSSRQACDQLMHLLNNRKAEFQKSVVDP
ncbi:LRR receptor-like serine/threonine-protein kinase GSO1 [Linum grandiflorum]